jgi:hypothetical protein
LLRASSACTSEQTAGYDFDLILFACAYSKALAKQLDAQVGTLSFTSGKENYDCRRTAITASLFAVGAG